MGEESDLAIPEAANLLRIPNPFRAKLCKDLTIGLPHGTIAYFQAIADELGLSLERVISIYLRNIAYTGYKIPIDMGVGDTPEQTPPLAPV
ncbi:hypothetical protein HSX11_04590 [Oxalobacteraceae bacterium]|nr:hypothetical protein [Oxalobacteraceae bacterium]